MIDNIVAQDPLHMPSDWVSLWATRIVARSQVLDLACGSGRHTRLLREMGFRVLAVDRDAAAVAALSTMDGVDVRIADLEAGEWPLEGLRFGGIVVTNYLHRPLFPKLLDALAPQGVLIFETFAAGNAQYGRPSNPAFLLQPGELLEVVRGRLRVIAYEDRYVDTPRPAMVQRICAQRA